MEKKEKKKVNANPEDDFPGYPHYPQNEDIYKKEKEEADIDPEHIDRLKPPVEKINKLNEKNFEQDVSGGDLDIPGADLDDVQEEIGSEDEENNHYSLGGDERENLEEDTGDRR